MSEHEFCEHDVCRKCQICEECEDEKLVAAAIKNMEPSPQAQPSGEPKDAMGEILKRHIEEGDSCVCTPGSPCKFHGAEPPARVEPLAKQASPVEGEPRPYNELSEIEQLRRDKDLLQRQLALVDERLKWEGTEKGRIETLEAAQSKTAAPSGEPRAKCPRGTAQQWRLSGKYYEADYETRFWTDERVEVFLESFFPPSHVGQTERVCPKCSGKLCQPYKSTETGMWTQRCDKCSYFDSWAGVAGERGAELPTAEELTSQALNFVRERAKTLAHKRLPTESAEEYEVRFVLAALASLRGVQEKRG